jgi:hypothetical protein
VLKKFNEAISSPHHEGKSLKRKYEPVAWCYMTINSKWFADFLVQGGAIE